MSPNYVWPSKCTAGSCNTWFHTAVVSTATPTLRQRYSGNDKRDTTGKCECWMWSVKSGSSDHSDGLRHTTASLAISEGANVKVVQRLLGHATAAMTLDRYGHLLSDDLAGVADALGKAIERTAVLLRYSESGSKAVERISAASWCTGR